MNRSRQQHHGPGLGSPARQLADADPQARRRPQQRHGQRREQLEGQLIALPGRAVASTLTSPLGGDVPQRVQQRGGQHQDQCVNAHGEPPGRPKASAPPWGVAEAPGAEDWGLMDPPVRIQ